MTYFTYVGIMNEMSNNIKLQTIKCMFTINYIKLQTLN